MTLAEMLSDQGSLSAEEVAADCEACDGDGHGECAEDKELDDAFDGFVDGRCGA